MVKYLCTVVETYRVESEADADVLINQARNNNLYDLTKSSITHKEIKSKGEVIDEYYLVALTKFVQDHKSPSSNIDIEYTF
jgi:hypothetical protein